MEPQDPRDPAGTDEPGVPAERTAVVPPPPSSDAHSQPRTQRPTPIGPGPSTAPSPGIERVPSSLMVPPAPPSSSTLRALDEDLIDLEDLLGEPQPRTPRPPSPRRASHPDLTSITPPTGIPAVPSQRAIVPPSGVTPPTGIVIGLSRGTPPPPPPGEPPPMGLDACLARLGVGLVETDAAGRIVRMNEAAERLLNLTAADGLVPVDSVLHTGAPPPRADGSEPDNADATAWIHRPDGEQLAVRHVLAPRDGAPGSVIVMREAQAGAIFAPALARRARYDPLTGLYSRRGLIERVEHARADSVRTGSRHALCYLDLDRFRLVNSTCGHDAGDDLLQWVATRLYEVLSPRDAAARIAGDEFAILLTDHDHREAERVARDIQRSLSEFRFAWGHKTFLVESSLGLHFFGMEADSADGVIASANHACSLSKKNGGARIQIYIDTDEDMAQSRRSLEWVAGIQHHLAAGKLVLFAQTIHPMGPRNDLGGHFEVLMRVIDDQGRFTSPVGIIQAAENGRVMDSIDRFVIRKAFQTIGALPRRALRNLELFSVNLSAISLAREGLLDFIVENLERCSVPPGKVCFEITETAALANLDEVRWLIQELGAMGCSFAIDDFGSGHASYGYIERLPVDYVKIDGMFVKDMMTNNLHRAIVESVNRIATTLGIKTVAECVETAAAAEVLAGMGVHFGQGWHYARPAPISEVCKALDVDGG